MIRTLTVYLTFICAAICLLLLAACRSVPPSGANTLTVLAAASLTAPFQEIGVQFESAHPGLKIQYSFASSQQLAQQLSQGAPADVFASAEPEKMQAVVDAGRVLADQVQVFAHNRLVVIVSRSGRAELHNLQDLGRPGVRLLLGAPEAPIGAYSQRFLKAAAKDPDLGPGYQAAILANVISYEPDVKSLYRKVALDEADAGIVYVSDVNGVDPSQVQTIEIPDHLNQQAAYVIAPIDDSPNASFAAEYAAFVRSPAGQEILLAYGFLP